MATEISTFDPGSIQTILDRDFAGGLRMLADAIDAGSMKGRLVRADGVAGPTHDPDAHVRLVLDVSAPVFMRKVGRWELGDGLETVE